MKTAFAASTLLLMSAHAHGQEISTNDAAHHLETITVTGTRTGETDLQTTPISITTFDDADLYEIGFEDVRDIAHATPGLNIAGNINFAQIYIRGIGTNNVFPGSETSSTVHYDGVYLARPLMIFSNFLDIERIEVLKGPQGTLYGRNSIGGTINIIPYLPSETLRAVGALEFGSFGKQRQAATLSGPLINDTLFGSLSVFANYSDGYVKNINPTGPSRFNDEDQAGIKGALRWRVTDDVEFIISTDYVNIEESPPIYKPTYQFGNGAFSTAAVFLDNPFEVNIANFEPTTELQNFGTSGKLTWDLSEDYQFISITAARGVDFSVRNDSDYTEIDVFDVFLEEIQNQFSQEFQITKTTGRFTWLVGGYFFVENERFDFNNFVLGGLAASVIGDTHTEAYAAFAQGNYAVTEQLSIIVGTRYNTEQKTIDGNDVTGINSDNQIDEQAWTPKIGFEYEASDTLFMYGSASQGFKSGGFNFLEPFFTSDFDSEFLDAVEIGVKSDWLDHRLRINSSLFYYDYQDLQVQVFEQEPPFGVIIDNAANARIRGADLEMSFLPTPSWRFDAGISYLDATYVDFIAAEDGLVVDAAGNYLNSAPEWTVDLTAHYYQDLPVGSLAYRLNYYWQDDEFFTPANLDTKRQSAYELINASISYTTDDERIEVSVYGNNLTDKDYINSIFDFDFINGVSGRINPRRNYGIRAIVRFD